MWIPSKDRVALPIVGAAIIAASMMSSAAPVKATSTTTAVVANAYALPPKSTPAELGPGANRKLPKIERWATNIIGEMMDQPQGLTEVQVVSAWHIRRVFRRPLGKAAWQSAIRIAWRESRLLPHAVNETNSNGTSDWGLFQLNDGGTLQYTGGEPGFAALHPRRNARAARYVVETTGWWPWGGML